MRFFFQNGCNRICLSSYEVCHYQFLQKFVNFSKIYIYFHKRLWKYFIQGLYVGFFKDFRKTLSVDFGRSP